MAQDLQRPSSNKEGMQVYGWKAANLLMGILMAMVSAGVAWTWNSLEDNRTADIQHAAQFGHDGAQRMIDVLERRIERIEARQKAANDEVRAELKEIKSILLGRTRN